MSIKLALQRSFTCSGRVYERNMLIDLPSVPLSTKKKKAKLAWASTLGMGTQGTQYMTV